MFMRARCCPIRIAEAVTAKSVGEYQRIAANARTIDSVH